MGSWRSKFAACALLAAASWGCRATAPAAGSPPPASSLPQGSPCPQRMALVPAALGKPAFCMDQYEVTVAEFRACLTGGKCPTETECSTWKEGQERLPVTCASIDQALAYCRGRGGRLATPQEWERAAGAKDPWGDAKLIAGGVCWERTEEQGPCPVGTSSQDVSRFGLYDMGANAPEWTYEQRDANPEGYLNRQQAIAGAHWTGQRSLHKLLGTSFVGPIWSVLEGTHVGAGFRCVLDIVKAER